MCFYADYEWFAAVAEEERGPAQAKTRCDECRLPIHAGEWRHTVHQKEHEACLNCDPDGDHDERGRDGKCDHGNAFDYVACDRCHALRQAIRKVEEAEGCRGSEAEPSYGGLYEEVGDGEGWDHYAERMLALGLSRELALVEPPDPNEVFARLAFRHTRWSDDEGPGEYPGAWDDDAARCQADEYEIGGEG